MPDASVRSKRQLERYYQNVKGYHELAERSNDGMPMVPPELLRRFVREEGLIIDVAGGSGVNAQGLGLHPSRYVCADLSFEGLGMALAKGRGLCVQGNATLLPFKDNIASTVLCSWSLEHMTNPGDALKEMIRVVKPGGRIVIWGPNWDNIFRKDFPQFEHKDHEYVRRVRWKIFLKMFKNEFLPFQYNPYINLDVAALTNPGRYIAGDTDAVHCVLCQETFRWFRQNGMNILHISDFSEMGRYLHNGWTIKSIRAVLKPLLPLLRHVPLVRWFVLRFPIVVEKPQ